MKIRENVPIKDLTTMRLGGEAKYVIEVENEDDIKQAYNFAEEKKLPVWIMGGGANTIGRDEGFEGAIVLNRLKGIRVLEQDDETILLEGYGGEVWDDFVKYATELGYSGIEAMSMIPGTLGAAPVQNIGAYGQDMTQVIEWVEVYDVKDKEFKIIPKSEMRMGYRKSRFNTEDTGNFLITKVVVRLRKGEMKPPFYNSLQRYVDENKITDFSPKNIRKIVSGIRSKKLPDPKEVASAGSFFKNVYLNPEETKAAEAKNIPLWKNADGTGKINSGWLIEECGLKGQEISGFLVSDKAALILINKNAKCYQDLAEARRKIIEAVKEKFGYTLEQEPMELVSEK